MYRVLGDAARWRSLLNTVVVATSNSERKKWDPTRNITCYIGDPYFPDMV